MNGWKTIIVGALVAAVGALQGMDFTQVLPNDPQTQGWIVTGLGAVMLVLRFLTSGPVGGTKA